MKFLIATEDYRFLSDCPWRDYQFLQYETDEAERFATQQDASDFIIETAQYLTDKPLQIITEITLDDGTKAHGSANVLTHSSGVEE